MSKKKQCSDIMVFCSTFQPLMAQRCRFRLHISLTIFWRCIVAAGSGKRFLQKLDFTPKHANKVYTISGVIWSKKVALCSILTIIVTTRFHISHSIENCVLVPLSIILL